MDARRGMWVAHGGRIAILAEVDPRLGDGELHYVNDQGETTETITHVPLSAISIAAYDDIPAPRRPDVDLAWRFGYL